MVELKAYVPCDCYEKGKTKPFPLPDLEQQFTKESMKWKVDLRTFYYDPPYEILLWSETACEHLYMMYHDETISGWGEIDEYLWAYKQVGWHKFPTLQQEGKMIKEMGSWSVSSCAKILQEIAFFEKQTNIGILNCLVDTKTGEIHLPYNTATESSFMMIMGPYHMGFNENGLSIFDTQRQTKVFRSKHFEIRLQTTVNLNPKAIWLRPVEYVALDGRQRFKCDWAIIDNFFKFENDPNERLANGRLHRTVIPVKVEQRPLNASHYQWITDSLKAACQAAIEIGHPLYFKAND
jgi:hypothetical protein